jgi:hypothetical protein
VTSSRDSTLAELRMGRIGRDFTTEEREEFLSGQ